MTWGVVRKNFQHPSLCQNQTLPGGEPDRSSGLRNIMCTGMKSIPKRQLSHHCVIRWSSRGTTIIAPVYAHFSNTQCPLSSGIDPLSPSRKAFPPAMSSRQSRGMRSRFPRCPACGGVHVSCDEVCIEQRSSKQRTAKNSKIQQANVRKGRVSERNAGNKQETR